jgi:hypothetical protein
MFEHSCRERKEVGEKINFDAVIPVLTGMQ